MRLSQLLSKGLVMLALLSGMYLLSVTQAKATTFSVTGDVTGTFDANLSALSPNNIFNDWNLTTSSISFLKTDLAYLISPGFALVQNEVVSLTPYTLFFVLGPLPTSTYSGSNSYSGFLVNGSTGGAPLLINGTYSQVPEAGTFLLLVAGLGMVSLAASRRKLTVVSSWSR
jgi:hypothetical protein